MRGEQREFGAGLIILRQIADALEQCRTFAIVEEFAGDMSGRVAEPIENGARKIARGDDGLPMRQLRRREVVCLSLILRKAKAAELPTRTWRKEIAIGCAYMRLRRGTGATTQHHLTDHELAVVLCQRSIERLITWVGVVGRARPLPYVAKGLSEMRVTAAGARMKDALVEKIAGKRLRRDGRLPFRFGWQLFPAQAAKAAASKRLTCATGSSGSTGRSPRNVKICPILPGLMPIERRPPIFLLHQRPAFR